MITYHDRLEEKLHETFFPSLKKTTQSCTIFYTIVYHGRSEEELHTQKSHHKKKLQDRVSFST